MKNEFAGLECAMQNQIKLRSNRTIGKKCCSMIRCLLSYFITQFGKAGKALTWAVRLVVQLDKMNTIYCTYFHTSKIIYENCSDECITVRIVRPFAVNTAIQQWKTKRSSSTCAMGLGVQCKLVPIKWLNIWVLYEKSEVPGANSWLTGDAITQVI